MSELLNEMVQYHIYDQEIYIKITELLKNHPFPEGAVNDTWISNYLKFSFEFAQDLEFQQMIFESIIPSKYDLFRNYAKVSIAYYTACLGNYDEALWEQYIINQLTRLNLSELGVPQFMQLFLTFNILSLHKQYRFQQGPAYQFLYKTCKERIIKNLPFNERRWYESGMQKNVTEHVQQLYSTLYTEYFIEKLGYIVDIFIPPNLVIEVYGPSHYFSDNQPTGPTVLKAKLLKQMNMQLIEVPYYEWNSLADKQTYLESLLSP